MSESVVHAEAVHFLENAYKIACSSDYEPTSNFCSEIDEIISGRHLTFRYILVNALLAQSTNPLINPLVLQSGSSLNGAYDARSLCHNVIVPFDKLRLKSRLGGSNEPFLNKPARAKEISLNNPVRAGQDKKYLQLLYSVLSRIQPSEAFAALCDALFFLQARPGQNLQITVKRATSGDKSQLLNFIESFVRESSHGETCVLVAGAMMEVIAPFFENYNVIVHPVNQSGASSHEVGDIDVYDGPELLYTIEVKDKMFTIADVDHSVQKAQSKGCEQLVFLKGTSGSLSLEGYSEKNLVDSYGEQGFDLSFVELLSFSNFLLAIAPNGYLERFLMALGKFCRTARVKDITRNKLIKCAMSFGWDVEID